MYSLLIFLNIGVDSDSTSVTAKEAAWGYITLRYAINIKQVNCYSWKRGTFIIVWFPI